MIYKICSRDRWRAAVEAGVCRGAEIDLEDGFIHFSTAAQIRETAARHFKDQTDLVLVAVEPAALGSALRWEPSRGGDLFPHLHGDLDVALVLHVDDLPLDGDGRHVFPPHVEQGLRG
jgi:uncharacterized protein (DUF952 family)